MEVQKKIFVTILVDCQLYLIFYVGINAGFILINAQLMQQCRPSPMTPLLGEGLFREPNSWGIQASVI
jgi:hypothetical protein